ncbi:MAG TPA: hypothetical protein VGF91_08150, partial [Solirubrobacteraceae bacterium]
MASVVRRQTGDPPLLLQLRPLPPRLHSPQPDRQVAFPQARGLRRERRPLPERRRLPRASPGPGRRSPLRRHSHRR